MCRTSCLKFKEQVLQYVLFMRNVRYRIRHTYTLYNIHVHFLFSVVLYVLPNSLIKILQ
jgi:hypothetical protein